MTKNEALDKWSEACAAIDSKGRFVRNGNWLPLSHSLRHKDCESATVTVVDQEESTILKIEPAPVDPKTVPPGKSVGTRPAFYLFVR